MPHEALSDVTPSPQGGGERNANTSEEWLPLVYEELRRLAASKLAREPPGHTLQATALVHEAYLRLLQGDGPGWRNRNHFFKAASEAMRRILVERARERRRLKRGGGSRERVPLEALELATDADSETLLQVDEAIRLLSARDPFKAELVKLRFFVGLSNAELARTLGVSEPTVKRNWVYARAWLYERLRSAGND